MFLLPRRQIWTQQPQGPTSTQDVFGYQVGEVVCPLVSLHKISGGIGVAARASGLAFIGDSVDNCASRSLTRPFVLGKGTELTFVCVFRRQGTAQTGNAIAGMGATGGDSGNTLFRITGGDSAADLKFQVQDGNGGIFYNINSSGVAVNDLGTHTAVIALSLSVGTGTLEFVIDGNAAGGTTIAGGTPSATTFDSVTACASIRGGAVIGAGDADVTLAYPIFGKVSQAQAISLSKNPWQIFKRPDSRIFVPVSAGGGTTTVTSDSAASYKVRGSVQSSASSSYAIRAAIQQDAASAYSIRGSINQGTTASYSLRGSVTQDTSATYSILSASSVSSSVTAGYAIKGSVQSSIVAGYSIAQAVQAEIAASYIIRSGVVSEAQAVFVKVSGIYEQVSGVYVKQAGLYQQSVVFVKQSNAWIQL